MYLGKAGGPGDHILLRELCRAYGLSALLEKAGALKAAEGCGAGHCDNDCTALCADCYTCPPNCAIKQ